MIRGKGNTARLNFFSQNALAAWAKVLLIVFNKLAKHKRKIIAVEFDKKYIPASL